MRAVLAPSLALAAASALAPAEADSPIADSAIGNLRMTQDPPTGRIPVMSRVDCLVPCCIHDPDGSLSRDATTEASENAQSYRK